MKNLTQTLFYASAILLAFACKKNDPFIQQLPSVRDTTVLVLPSVTTVYYSDWVTIASAPHGPDGSGSGGSGSGSGSGSPASLQSFSILASAINQNILDYGVVLAYAKLAGETVVRSLATTNVTSGYVYIWDFNISLGKIQFTETTTNPAGILPISAKNEFRYVVVPANKHVRLSKPLKDMTYEEICDMFNIPK
ncbi:unnamed protein product [Rotaria sp. Silwood2]|nr:unnamed protein product [Rotaria sp. Silwood2]